MAIADALNMEIPELIELDINVQREISKLPTMDPLRLSGSSPLSGDSEGKIRDLINNVCLHSARVSFQKRINDEYFAAGPIEELLNDPGVTEVIINGRTSIWYEKQGHLHRLRDSFLSELNYRNFVARLSRDASIEANLDTPFADGKWRECRVHIAIPPASGDEALITLRRHPLSPWTLLSLQEKGWARPEACHELNQLVKNKMNFLIVGCTGSGKTSVLNACLNQLRPNERAVMIEDTAELHLPNPASVRLLTRRDPQGLLKQVDQSELVRQALRMRPDRLIMGEIRGGEAKDLLMAFATGHSGCIGTLHAESARQALLRLEMLIQLGAPQWSLNAVRTLIWLSLQAIVVVSRDKDGNRKLDGIYRIASLEEIGFLIEKTT